MILLIGEVFMTGIRNPLWDTVLHMDDTWGAICWYGFWLSCYLAMMTLLYYMHVWVNVTKTRDTQVIIWMIIGLSALTLLRYLSAISVKSEIIFYLYQFGLPAINICMGLYLLSVLIRNVINVNISVSLRRDIH